MDHSANETAVDIGAADENNLTAAKKPTDAKKQTTAKNQTAAKKPVAAATPKRPNAAANKGNVKKKLASGGQSDDEIEATSREEAGQDLTRQAASTSARTSPVQAIGKLKNAMNYQN